MASIREISNGSRERKPRTREEKMSNTNLSWYVINELDI